MTKYIVSAATLATLATALQGLSEDATAFDPSQNELDLSGEQQAIEHFMAERADMLEQIDNDTAYIARLLKERDEARTSLTAHLQNQDAQKVDLQRQLGQAVQDQRDITSAAIHAAQYVEALQNRLVSIGISFAPGNDNLPAITINPAILGELLDNVARG